MKLVHPHLDRQFDFERCALQQLLVENQREFLDLTTQLYLQCTKNNEAGEWVLSHHNNLLNLEKEALYIYDYYNFDLNNKKVSSLLNSEVLKVLMQNDYLQEMTTLQSAFSILNDKVLAELDLPIACSHELVFEDVIKLSKYQIEEDLTLPTKILTYIDIFLQLKKIKLVIFINSSQVLMPETLQTLFKELQYKEIKVLCIDGVASKIELAERTIIDMDLCTI